MSAFPSDERADRASRIPGHLVYDFDFYSAPELECEPHMRLRKLHQEAPEIFWTHCNGGHWVVARVAPALEMLRQHALFSSDPAFNKILDRWPRLAPNQYDPPTHTQFRNILNPWFLPGAVRQRQEEIRELAAQLIEGVLGKGHCEFVTEIAEQFSVIIFLRMVDAPLEERTHLLAMAAQWTRGATQQTRDTDLQSLAKFLRELMDLRRKKPGGDLLSHILQGQIDGRSLNDEELLGLTTLTFLGGLDTVASMLAFIISFLARNPDHYRQLTADPARIERIIDELMRVHGVAGMERGATSAFESRGVHFEEGDRIVFLPQMFGLDDQRTSNPEIVDFDRGDRLNLVFGAGPHRCIGAHLARAELVVFLEEWVKRVPEYHAVKQGPPATRGGLVWTLVDLPLAWP